MLDSLKTDESSHGEKTTMPEAETTLDRAEPPLSQEIRTTLEKEESRLWGERGELRRQLEEQFVEIVGLGSGSEDLDGEDLKEVGAVRKAIEEHYNDMPALRKALSEITMPLLFELGTFWKIQRLTRSPEFDRLANIDQRLQELREKLSK